MGFFIPAEKFETEIFHNFFFLGEYDGENEYDRGLSFFGKEICAVSEALKYSDKKTFYIIDEFARTTNSIEAKALTAGLMKKLTKQKNVFCIISTHLMKLPKVNNIKFYRMKGLNVEKYGNSIHTHIKQNIDESIKIINSHMDYIVLKDNGKSEIYDAVMVAKLLGADFELLEYAESMMKK
jgi:DNA mismatch repair ATPase MutS